MEPPAKFSPDAVRDEKLKVIRALDPINSKDIVRGQYSAVGTEKGYLEAVENLVQKQKVLLHLNFKSAIGVGLVLFLSKNW